MSGMSYDEDDDDDDMHRVIEKDYGSRDNIVFKRVRLLPSITFSLSILKKLVGNTIIYKIMKEN